MNCYLPVRIFLSVGLIAWAISILSGLLSCNSESIEDLNTLTLYNESFEFAKKNNQKILIVFGADWCPDCNSLRQRMEDNKEINNLLTKNYLVFNVDVGRFNKNLKFAEKFGSPQKKGIPALVIVDPNQDGKVLATTEGGEFSEASKMEDSAIYKYLAQFSKP